MTKLSVNVNKIALLRNSRGGGVPDVVDFGRRALAAGADGLTVHPRADQRHITAADARAVRRTFRDVEVNFEGDVREEFLELVLTEKPDQCTLVPVSYGEVTSNRGWDVAKWDFLLRPILAELRRNGIRSSLFVEADPDVAAAAAAIGADRIEIYTGPYAHAFARGDAADTTAAIARTVHAARSAGLGINAGHDLTAENLAALRAAADLDEVSIGHHLVSEALVEGFATTVGRYKAACLG